MSRQQTVESFENINPTADMEILFDELLQEMRLLNKMKERPRFTHAAVLLSTEISRVWNLLTCQLPEEPQLIQLSDKILIPTLKDSRGRNCNLIGRILGPCGISVKQLEAATGCEILIRGKGSVKDEKKEDRLRGTPGYEHLFEPLHVFIKAEDEFVENAEKNLQKAIGAVNRLLIPRYDEHKRNQLVTHAVIRGTYRQNYKRKCQK